jgi:hypothetical protein
MNNCLYNWYPVKLLKEGNELKCQWKYFEGVTFIDPFFSETLTKASSININSSNYRSVSDLTILIDWATTFDVIQPTALIFHISRCGSTLLSQALTLTDEHNVLSEVPFIDDLLKLLTIDEWLVNTGYQKILKAAISIYGQQTNYNQKRLLIKSDSWHIYYTSLFRLLYPNTPFLLLYREPNEVLQSQQKKRGMHAVPDLIPDEILGVTKGINEYVDLDTHIADVLKSYLSSFIKITPQDSNILLCNYNEGIENIIDNLAQFINMEIDESYRAKINERCRYNAKYPDQQFTSETIHYDIAESSTLQLLYNELEELRNLQIQ